MMENELPPSGDFYKDKADGLYQVLLTAVNTIDRGSMVVYQELRGTYPVWVIPAELFQAGFTRVDLRRERENGAPVQPQNAALPASASAAEERGTQYISGVEAISGADGLHSLAGTESTDGTQSLSGTESRIHSGLMDFLDARTYQEKLEILDGMRSSLNDRVLSDIGMALDISVEDKKTEEKYLVIRNYLKTQIRFEDRRLR